MEKRHSKIHFSPFIVGTMRLGQWGEKFNTKQWHQFIEACLNMGLRDFDHADIYGDYTTESDFGKALKQHPSLREQIQITTKCGIKKPSANTPNYQIKSYDSSVQHIIHSVENSLKHFNTDYLDVLLLHRPDYLMDPHEIANCFHKLQESGKVLHFGVSNFSLSQFEMVHQLFPLVTHQMEISLFQLQAFSNGQLDQLLSKNIHPTAWSPLGGGSEALQNMNGGLKTVIKGLCEKYGIDTGQLLLAWLLKHPAGIVPVLGTSKLARLKEAMAVKMLQLEKEDWYAMYSASKEEKLP